MIDPTRLRPWFGDAPRARVPDIPGCSQLAHERFDMTKGALAGLVLLPLWTFGLAVAIKLLGGRSEYDADLTLMNAALALAISLVLVPLLHEAIHGLAALLFGARPSFGIGPGFAYTTFHEPLRRVAYLTVGLAPLVVLSLASVLLAARWDAGAGWCLFFAVVNASGAVGDLWMSWRIARQPRGALYIDLADGFAVLLPAHDPAAQPVTKSSVHP